MTLDNLELAIGTAVQEPPRVELPVEPVPVVEPVLEPELEPVAEPEPTPVEDEYYTPEEFEALPQSEKEAIWAEHGGKPEPALVPEPAKPTVDAVLSNLLNLQETYQKKIDNLESVYQKRLSELAEAAKGTDAEPKYRELRKFDKDAKDASKDGQRVSKHLQPKIYYDEKNTPPLRGETQEAYRGRVNALNMQANWAQNERLIELENIVEGIIEPYKPLLERVDQEIQKEVNSNAWGTSTIEILQELKIPKEEYYDRMQALQVVLLQKDLLGKGAQFDEVTRREFVRALIATQSGKPAPVQADGKTLFRKLPTGTMSKPTTGNAPRRKKPPRTMGGIGTSSGRTSGQIKSPVNTVFNSEFSINQD